MVFGRCARGCVVRAWMCVDAGGCVRLACVFCVGVGKWVWGGARAGVCVCTCVRVRVRAVCVGAGGLWRRGVKSAAGQMERALAGGISKHMCPWGATLPGETKHAAARGPAAHPHLASTVAAEIGSDKDHGTVGRR